MRDPHRRLALAVHDLRLAVNDRHWCDSQYNRRRVDYTAYRAAQLGAPLGQIAYILGATETTAQTHVHRGQPTSTARRVDAVPSHTSSTR